MNKVKTIWKALQKLKADKEDTAQVFIILSALGERASAHTYKKFMSSAKGAEIIARDKNLLEHLCDRAALAAMPQGSLGRVYYEFTEREQITADGLAEASEAGTYRYDESEQRGVFHQRQRDAHDLWHTLCGYGRDPLGELALLAFTWRQMGNIGIWFIIALGVSTMWRELGFWRIMRVLFEGVRVGGRAQWLPLADWENLLPQDLEKVRRELNITSPEKYVNVRTEFADVLAEPIT